MSSRVLTAVAWPYANGPRHIGHVSGFGVPSDVFSRYQRMAGNRVLMVSGTDEHGTPIQVQADAEGLTARQLADKYNRVIVEDLQGLGLGYDLFTRTTTSNHYQVVQDLFLALYRNGYVVAKTTMGAISPSTGRTLPDRYVEGTCPICGYDSARGDQCDNCGNQLDPADLINPRSKINGETPQFVDRKLRRAHQIDRRETHHVHGMRKIEIMLNRVQEPEIAVEHLRIAHRIEVLELVVPQQMLVRRKAGVIPHPTKINSRQTAGDLGIVPLVIRTFRNVGHGLPVHNLQEDFQKCLAVALVGDVIQQHAQHD